MKISSKKLLSLLFLLIVLLTAYFLKDLPQETKAVAAPSWYEVVKVTDGDTINVKIDNKKVGIRMIGLNTPETVDPRITVQCFGREASNKAKEMLTGQTVRLEADATQDDKDKYDRLLRYVYLSDGTLFNKWMIENGFGFEYTYDSNPYQYQADFKAAEKAARDNKSGLWADSACGGKLKSL
ncbi:nuclease [Candidatus Falkowbacteria bacterium CG10_big_fil_rev_8_21_14_0_10_39_9]|uniref:Nuclease n=1 Tax=Candidatus Falkowbacteria bacterium CG10_big_fil_rev_8_21_14_0_10_39_9 TaxID=1974566 RepID=A0A2M6WQE8_9BACT|nr:MAG: nuclease [Candidatus Falkowbacteria bacterium CG10_big_fil_rev_8_21_14_0_10_39_9]